VQRARKGQARQATPKVTCRLVLIGRVMPLGQVAVPACSSTQKSSTVNPPATPVLTGHGLTSGTSPARVSSSSMPPVP